ncbi:MAG: rubredoxin, partial [Candidatus Methanomethylophilaceae archaeon]|nr:rubredoxin [Candidatus Methanomethylophilaceae archaeon]
MASYICTVCGEIYDEEKEGVKFSDLPDSWSCPKCHALKGVFMPVMKTGQKGEKQYSPEDLEIDPSLVLHDEGVMDEIHRVAVTGKSIGEAMDTLMPVPNFDDILILGAQLSRFPKADKAEVNIRTVIGKDAKRPMVLESPIYISHMSFGALSASAKIALSKGSAIAKTAMCSGEGGALEDEMMSAYRYIFEYIPNKYSVNENTFRHSAAVEIKIGQGTKPGMGGHLPGEKVTDRIAEIRGKPKGKDILSPSKFDEINSPEDLKKMVDDLRSMSDGLPIGVKIAAGHIEEDLEFISHSGCDFITIDGRGGATGSSPKYLKDASSVPTVYALSRARRYMDEHDMCQQLVITGGLRTSRDFIKALA